MIVLISTVQGFTHAWKTNHIKARIGRNNDKELQEIIWNNVSSSSEAEIRTRWFNQDSFQFSHFQDNHFHISSKPSIKYCWMMVAWPSLMCLWWLQPHLICLQSRTMRSLTICVSSPLTVSTYYQHTCQCAWKGKLFSKKLIYFDVHFCVFKPVVRRASIGKWVERQRNTW